MATTAQAAAVRIGLLEVMDFPSIDGWMDGWMVDKRMRPRVMQRPFHHLSAVARRLPVERLQGADEPPTVGFEASPCPLR
jgi:hypothetical protein